MFYRHLDHFVSLPAFQALFFRGRVCTAAGHASSVPAQAHRSNTGASQGNVHNDLLTLLLDTNLRLWPGS